MHFRVEVVLPPTDDVARDVGRILAPYNENCTDEEGARSSAPFWDWYVIGGRFAGDKVRCWLGEERISAFLALLQERQVTVSAVTCGKQTLQPASQIPEVDALWREYFPDSGLDVCPIFSHSNNQYQENLPADICTVAGLPPGLTADRVVFAGPSWGDDGTMQAKHIEQVDFWNGTNYVKSDWDGTVATALARYQERVVRSTEEYQARYAPRPDWLVVSVDCHS